MSFLQAQFGAPRQPGLSIGTPDVGLGGFSILLTTLAAVAAVLLALFACVWLLRAVLRARRYVPSHLRNIFLLVMLPREASSEAKKEENAEQVRSQIAVAETWLSALGGMRAQRGLRAWLWSRSDHFSFEIVAQHGLISFYVVVPSYLRQFMEQQILAQYPEASVNEVEEYNIFSPQSAVLSSSVRFTRDHFFPINTYLKLSSDPLQALTNSLSGVQPNDGLAIQIIARSAKRVWHRSGSRVAREMQKGRTLQEALVAARGWRWSEVPFQIVNFFRAANAQPKKEQAPITTPTPLVQQQIQGIEQKTSKAGLDVNIRVIVSAADEPSAQRYRDNVVNSFAQFNFYEYGNSLKASEVRPGRLVKDFIYRNYDESQKLILNAEELASIFHFPTPYLDTPNIRWLLARKLPPPSNLPAEGILLGESIFRGQHTNIFLKPSDRQRHMYVVGMTGTGKSVLLSNMAIQDIRDGQGVCVIDPHGGLVESILEFVPRERIDDVIYFNPADTERPIGLNMLEADTPEQQDFAVQEMIAIFYKLVTDPSMIGPMFEHNMRNAMLTLMADREEPGTLVEIPRMFTDPAFQRQKVAKVTDPMVRSFWEQEMAKTSDFHKSEMLGYLISKIGRFVENVMVRNIVGQPRSGFNFRQIMDQQKILLVNLSKGVVGEVNSNLLGLILVSKLQMAALARADMPEGARKDFYLYIDEFQNFITDSISTILAEARKYRLNLIMAHQYLGQLSSGGVEAKGYGNKIRDAIFGNVGTLVTFRIGNEDAEVLAKQLAPTVNEYDLGNIERFNAYVRMLIDNQPARPFNMRTFPPQEGDTGVGSDIRQFSRWKYGQDERKVSEDILRRSQLGMQHAERISLTPPPAR